MKRIDCNGIARFYWEPRDRRVREHAERVLHRACAGDPEASLEWSAILKHLGLPEDIGYMPPEGCFWVPLDKAMIIRK